MSIKATEIFLHLDLSKVTIANPVHVTRNDIDTNALSKIQLTGT